MKLPACLMSEIVKLVIAVPSAGTTRMDFTSSVTGLISKLASDCLPTRPECGLEVSLDIAMSSVIHGNRETLVMRAIESGKTHLLFLDDDMAFDPRVVDSLFSRRQSVVATNYLIKTEARDSFVAVGLDGKRVVTRENSTGILPIAYSGFGVSLFDIEVFKKTPQPWFLPKWIEDKKIYTTEDNPFYERVRNSGFTVYLDQDASKLVTHLGNSSWNWKEFKNG
jgi:hypothetical protein